MRDKQEEYVKEIERLNGKMVELN